MISNRMTQIIKILKNENTVISGKQICFELGITTRTLRNQLAMEKEPLFSIGLEIESVHRRGYVLNIIDAEKYYDYMTQSIQDNNLNTGSIPSDPEGRVHYIIQRLLVSSNYIKSDDLADAMYVSRSTLNNDLIKVKENLEYFGLEIISKPAYGLRLSGSETKRRSAISLYFYGATTYSSIVAKRDEESIYNEISHVVLELMHRYDFRLTDLGFKNLVTHIIITMIRMNDKFYAPKPINTSNLDGSDALKISHLLCDCLEEKYNLEFPESERIYIAMHLTGKKSSQYINTNSIDVDKYSLIFRDIYQFIDTSYKIDLSHDLDFYTALALHFQPMIHRLEYELRMENPLLDTIKQEQTLAFEISIGIARILSQHWGYSISEEEIGYIALHVALSIESYYEKSNRKNILIVCASGVGSSQILYHKVKQQFGQSIEALDVSERYGLETMDLNQYDLILTTVPIEDELEIPIIQVNYFLDSGNVREISALLNSKDQSFEFVDKYFKDELFFTDLQAQDMQSMIAEMCSRIPKKFGVDQQFLKSVLEREAYSSTEFGNQIAMPHPMKPMTHETFVAIGVLDKPIRWKKHLVKYVILMSIAKETKESLSIFHEVLSALALDSKAMLEFSKVPTLETLKAILYTLAEKEKHNDIDVLFK